MGESWDYFFEDGEGTFLTEAVDGLPRVKQPVRYQELQVRLRVSVVSVKGDIVEKRVDLLHTKYRELSAEQLGGKADVPLKPISALIPGFPETFSYSYNVDEGKVVEQLQTYFKGYLSSPFGSFLYYKLLDLHTFQGTAEHLPPESLGRVSTGESRDIPLQDGVFHNHGPVRLLQRIDMVDGLRQAYYKIMTLGNYYKLSKLDGSMDTNYRYTFYVPVEGALKGIVSEGELQEEVVLRGKPIVIERQLSLHLQTPQRKSGI